MKKQILWSLVPMFALLTGHEILSARERPVTKEVVQIRFVDSAGHPIPYFSSYEIRLKPADIAKHKEFISNGAMYYNLLPCEYGGTVLRPLIKTEVPYFVKEIDISGRLSQQQTLPGPTVVAHYFVFPDGQVLTLTSEETSSFARDKENVLTVPGQLGAGTWRELGDCLFEAAVYWRTGRGSQTALIERCDALIKQRQKEGDFQWAGNLVLVRELWLKAKTRYGDFERTYEPVTPQERAELPWGNTRATFAKPESMYAYPIEPYRAFKEVLKVNPGDIRAIFWTEVLPWINGFAPEGGPGKPTSDDLIRECKRVYLAHRDLLGDSYRFWALTTLVRAVDGATYVERYRLHLKGVKHDEDFQWAIDDLSRLLEKWPFLESEMPETRKSLEYIRDASWIDPLVKR